MDLYPGRPLMVLGRFRGPASGTVVVTGDGVDGPYRREIPIEDHLERREHAPLQTLWARERVARLVDRDVPDEAALKEVEALGLRHRLLTERTSFVVVDPQKRNVAGDLAVVAQPAVMPQDMVGSIGLGGLMGASIGASSGVGGLGVRGTGAGGGGLGAGVGLGSGGGRGGSGLGVKSDRDISMSVGQPVILGSLDREVIRRVVKAHTAQVRYCYERRLVVNPTLAGQLALRFVIGADGQVKQVTVQNDRLGDADVASCLMARAKTWLFPQPAGGGVVIVTYPFRFAPAP
jgi:hypothetical protein